MKASPGKTITKRHETVYLVQSRMISKAIEIKSKRHYPFFPEISPRTQMKDLYLNGNKGRPPRHSVRILFKIFKRFSVSFLSSVEI